MVAQEIVDVPPTPSYAHGEITIALGAALYPYVRAHRLGHVFAARTTYHIDGLPDRLPDLTFVAGDKTPPPSIRRVMSRRISSSRSFRPPTLSAPSVRKCKGISTTESDWSGSSIRGCTRSTRTKRRGSVYSP